MDESNLADALDGLAANPQDHNLAGHIIDLSAERGDLNAAEKALETIKAATARSSDEQVEMRYMLGTAQATVARLRSTEATPAWAEASRELRLEARSNLFAATASSHAPVRTMAWTNLGHELSRTARLSEAYDCYERAYRESDHHPVGAGWMAVTLKSFNDQSKVPNSAAVALAHKLAQTAQEDSLRVDDVALAGVSGTFAALPTDRAGEHRPQPVPASDSYEAFIRDNRLYLTAAVDGIPESMWDDADIFPFHEPGGSLDDGPPPILAMTNILKADYLLARRLAYGAFLDPRSDSKLFIDTRDGARYGAEPALYRLAFRSALDCLDRVGSAVNSNWDIGIPTHKVHFHTMFRMKGDLKSDLRAQIQHEFDHENWAMVALVDLSDDLHSNESWLADYRLWRNTATHQFLRTVPGVQVAEADGPLTDISFDDLATGTIRSLAIARSALLNLFSAARKSAGDRARAATRGGFTWGAGGAISDPG
ncbi:MAG: LA2681 family HEPN domain-containing protein [Acidimicrobiales bacterium]